MIGLTEWVGTGIWYITARAFDKVIAQGKEKEIYACCESNHSKIAQENIRLPANHILTEASIKKATSKYECTTSGATFFSHDYTDAVLC